MASKDSPVNLESWLNEATDPNNEEERWDCIQGFYELVNQETDGPQVATRLLAHKIQSPQEKQALQAVTVLEACMNNCGKRFHSEAAKFRFLNELIKILLPKYFGHWTSQKVKDRVTEVLYGWSVWLKDEPKIQEAYHMLKKQGVVTKDPKLPDVAGVAPPPQRTSDSVFDQEDKTKLLARLLKSSRPEDLETANRLIKSTIKEEQEKAERLSKRVSTLNEVERSTKQLRELLKQNPVSGPSLQSSDDLKAVYERCDRLRPSLFRLASDTMDDDSALAQILEANDELTLVLSAYKDRVEKPQCNGRGSKSEDDTEEKTKAPVSPVKSYHLIDLSALESSQTHKRADSPPQFKSSPPASYLDSTSHSIADQEFTELEAPKSYYEELMQLNGEIQMNTGSVLRARGCGGSTTSSNDWSLSQSQQVAGSGSVMTPQKPDEDDQWRQFKSSQIEPITVYDQCGIHIALHFAKDCPPGRPSVAVMVISTVNTSGLEVKHFSFQAAVPKTMSVKLQPASATTLPPYNPLLPPPAISQVLLLANPQKHKVRLRYKLTLTHGNQQLNEMGEIGNFPDWASLVGL
ncbi:ADP-ribosylation factor-binding protein GGA1-like [Thalassophryne amazonica]|uniref:ADP-ribosylation factor-binding protein GGA1-like n=1 Tax=Thalassophryne amazonica TaxID=390379 RepID=UPI001471DA3E|nr:ADP-ribosylation factor-binding protein GGA1-like [Thalassophryne amazonica]